MQFYAATFVIICLALDLAVQPIYKVAAAVVPSSLNTFCAPGSIEGHPPIVNVPAYDYDSSGLLQFHFHFNQGEWNYNTLRLHFYDLDCSLQGEPGYGQAGGVYLPPANNLLVKVEEFFPNKFNFKVYDEDTGQFQGSGLGAVPNDFNSPFISFSLTNIGGSYNAPIVDGVTTPAAPLQKPAEASSHVPVLIIPGVMGTELYKGTALVWPNVGHMLTDIGDDFLDSLAFNSDLTPVDGSITAGGIVKEPAPGEHYYDLLFNDLVSRGYKENLDLFTFTYDWRWGINETNLALLRSKIDSILSASGHDKVDVVTHSAGGVLFKKYVYDNGGSKIDKAVMVGVPELGAPTALKTLTAGDNLDIPWLSASEMRKIGTNMPMVYDLLPSKQYSEANGSYVHLKEQNLISSKVEDLDFGQTSQWLVDNYGSNSLALQQASQLHSQSFDDMDLTSSGLDAYIIAGCRTDTIGGLTETHFPSLPGLPPTLEFSSVSGDVTVPLGSTKALQHDPEKTYYALNADHGKMLSQEPARNLIIKILTGDEGLAVPADLITQDPLRCGIDDNNNRSEEIASPRAIEIPTVSSPNSYSSGAAAASGTVAPAIDISLVPTSVTNLTTVLLASHPNGTLINDQGTIYLLQAGQKLPFRSLGEFQSYGYRFVDTIMANDSDRALPEGSPILVKPGTVVLGMGEKKLYYLINERGEKRLFASLKALIKRGYKTRIAIKLTNLADYVSGARIY